MARQSQELMRAAASTTPGGRGRSAARQDGRILVVDDNEDSRLALRALLESLGYEVYEARDGQEAVSRTARLRPGLVLMDIMMPRMDGLEATRLIRGNPALSDVRIVCVSAMEGAVEASLAAGSDDCVLKPIYDLNAFGARVADWLHLERRS